MSGICESDATPMRNKLEDALKRELSTTDDRTIHQVLRELGDIGVHDLDDLKEVKKSDIESLSLKKIPQRKLRRFVDKLNGVTAEYEPQSSSQPKNFAAVVCARGSEEAKVTLIGSTITLTSGDGEESSSSGNVKNKAVLGEGNVEIIATDSPIYVDAGDKKKKKPEPSDKRDQHTLD